MYPNGVIFQAYCVNFEIKKNKMQHHSFQIIYDLIFQGHCVNFDINKKQIAEPLI
jgi:hypothetical protein